MIGEGGRDDHDGRAGATYYIFLRSGSGVCSGEEVRMTQYQFWTKRSSNKRD